MNRWLVVFVAVLILGSGWLWWSRPNSAASAGSATGANAAEVDPAVGPGVGRMAPDFELPTLDGGTFRLSEQRGQPVVLNFWATWCGPCQRELPALQNAAEHFGGDVVFAGVDQGEEAAVVQEYVDKLGLTFAIPMDAEGSVGLDYNVQGLPTTFFIDRNGVIRSLWMGEMNSVTLAENIATIR
jgi:peroxiredoxin